MVSDIKTLQNRKPATPCLGLVVNEIVALSRFAFIEGMVLQIRSFHLKQEI